MAVDPLHPLCEEFVRLQKICGWSDAQIADELHVDRASVFRWRKGKMRPEPSKLILLASRIGTDVHIGSERFMDRAAPRALDDWERELLDVIRPIPPKERAAFTRSLAEVVKVLRTPLDYGKTKKRPGRPVSSPAAAQAAAAAARKAAELAGAPLSEPAAPAPSTPATSPPPPATRETRKEQPRQKPFLAPP